MKSNAAGKPHKIANSMLLFMTPQFTATNTSVDTRSASPIDHIRQLPGVLVKLDLQLSLFVDHQLAP
jgi:hypothetical protein